MQDLSDKQRWRSKQGEAGEQKAKATRVLTDRNDYPQNSNCDVVAYEVVITRSWDEKTERKKNKTKQKVPFKKTPFPKFSCQRETQVWSITMETTYLHTIQAENPSDFTLDRWLFLNSICKSWGISYKCNEMRFKTTGDKCISRD